MNALNERLRHHVTGAIERGEATPVVGMPAGRIFIDRLDHVSDLADVIACATWSDGLPLDWVKQEFDNSLDALDMATEEGWTRAGQYVDSMFELHKAWIAEQLARPDIPRCEDGEQDSPLLFIMTGKRAIVAGDSNYAA